MYKLKNANIFFIYLNLFFIGKTLIIIFSINANLAL